MTWAEARDTLADWRLYIHYLVVHPNIHPTNPPAMLLHCSR